MPLCPGLPSRMLVCVIVCVCKMEISVCVGVCVYVCVLSEDVRKNAPVAMSSLLHSMSLSIFFLATKSAAAAKFPLWRRCGATALSHTHTFHLLSYGNGWKGTFMKPDIMTEKRAEAPNEVRLSNSFSCRKTISLTQLFFCQKWNSEQKLLNFVTVCKILWTDETKVKVLQRITLLPNTTFQNKILFWPVNMVVIVWWLGSSLLCLMEFLKWPS